MATEIWRPIKDFAARYEISSWGRIRNIQTGKYMKVFLAANGQRNPAVSLTLNGSPHNFSLVKLMAETFLGEPPKGTHLAFKDGDRANCRRSNLYYASPTEHRVQSHEGQLKLSLSDAVQRIWKELIPDTQKLLKKYDLLTPVDAHAKGGEYGITSRWTAEMK